MGSQQFDLSELQSLLKSGADSAWRDEAGNTLLHHAARLGDKEVVAQCIAKGVQASAYNNDNECARDVARSWGHDAVARLIDAEMKRGQAAAPVPPLAYASLQEIRDKSSAAGVNILHGLAAQGSFGQVVALTMKAPESFTAEDFLTKGADGDSVLLKICQQGQQAELLKPELWVKNLNDFFTVWENVPKPYRAGLDVEGFISRTRQLRLTSRAPKTPFGKSPKP
jgi:ankyrin repeat protein